MRRPKDPYRRPLSLAHSGNTTLSESPSIIIITINRHESFLSCVYWSRLDPTRRVSSLPVVLLVQIGPVNVRRGQALPRKPLEAKLTNLPRMQFDYDLEQFPYHVRSRDSLRSFINQQFTTHIAIYDGALGTMIQNDTKRSHLDEAECRSEDFKD